jgi:hypothetical protein
MAGTEGNVIGLEKWRRPLIAWSEDLPRIHAYQPMSMRRPSADRRGPPACAASSPSPSMDIHEHVRLGHTHMRTVVLYLFLYLGSGQHSCCSCTFELESLRPTYVGQARSHATCGTRCLEGLEEWAWWPYLMHNSRSILMHRPCWNGKHVQKKYWNHICVHQGRSNRLRPCLHLTKYIFSSHLNSMCIHYNPYLSILKGY